LARDIRITAPFIKSRELC